MRILVVRLDAIGDLVLMSPFLRELRRLYPTASVTLLVRPQTFNVVELCPYVDEVSVRQGLTWLWRRRWDLAISPRFDIDHFGANRILRLSFARRQVRWRDPDRFNSAARHEVDRNLEVLQWLGATPQSAALETWREPEDVATAHRLLEAHGVGQEKKFIALVPGASHAAKQWPLENFIAIGRQLVEQGFTLLVLGSEQEKPLGQALSARIGRNVIDVTGETSLRQAGALLSNAFLYVGNDTGLMHLAAAEQVPVVMISRHHKAADDRTRSSPARFGPWGVLSEIVQPLSGDITRVSVHDVRDAILTLDRRGLPRSFAQRNRSVSARARV